MIVLRKSIMPLTGLPYNRSISIGKRWLSDSAKAKEDFIAAQAKIDAIGLSFINEMTSAGEITEKTDREVKALSYFGPAKHRRNGKELKPDVIWAHFFSPTTVDTKIAEKVHCRLSELFKKRAYDELIELTIGLPSAAMSGNPENLILFCKASIESNYYNPYQVYILVDRYIQKFGESNEALNLRGRVQAHRAEAAKNYAEMMDKHIQKIREHAEAPKENLSEKLDRGDIINNNGIVDFYDEMEKRKIKLHKQQEKLNQGDVISDETLISNDYDCCFPTIIPWAEAEERYRICKEQSESDLMKMQEVEERQFLVSSKD